MTAVPAAVPTRRGPNRESSVGKFYTRCTARLNPKKIHVGVSEGQGRSPSATFASRQLSNHKSGCRAANAPGRSNTVKRRTAATGQRRLVVLADQGKKGAGQQSGPKPSGATGGLVNAPNPSADESTSQQQFDNRETSQPRESIPAIGEEENDAAAKEQRPGCQHHSGQECPPACCIRVIPATWKAEVTCRQGRNPRSA